MMGVVNFNYKRMESKILSGGSALETIEVKLCRLVLISFNKILVLS